MAGTFDLTKLLAESSRPNDEMLRHIRGLASKWQKTGLLEGLKNETERGNMALMLENQAFQLVTEASRTGTATNAEQWSGVALPLVRKVFGEISAKEYLSVQPMNLPSGLIFYMEFKYGSNRAPRLIGQSLYGDTTSSAAPAGGLYGAGQFAYTINEVTASFAAIFANAPAPTASVDFAISPTGLTTVTVPFSSLPAADKTAIRSFEPSGSGWTVYYPQYTKLNAAQDSVVFVVVGASGSATVAKVTYSVQPTDESRGDFEDVVGSSIPPTGVDLNIPEINLELSSVPIVAETRKLKAVWTPELAQDLNAYHSIDAEAELTAMLSQYISLEIDLELLDMLLVNAQTTDYWSANIGTIWNGTGFAADATLAGQAWTNMTWYQTLGQVMQRTSNKIHQLTLRGGANFAVVSPQLATIIESIPGFAAKTDGNQSEFASGVSAVGSFQSRFTIYKNPYFAGNVMLMGFRGNSFLETGAVYAPYVPLIMTPLVLDPQNFTPRRGVLTRYAKKMVRPEFYAKIICHGVPV